MFDRLPSVATRTVATLATLVALVPAQLDAQDDRFSFHGSLNAAYGKSDGLPVFGINKDGTSDYRAVSMILGYKVSDNDRVVTQLLHRRIGTSPLSETEPAVNAIWAFLEHKFDNGTAVKLGRNPHPRGIFNEVRFVGTLLPFYRVGATVYGETLENIDGVVVSKSFALGDSWGLDASAFGGGFDIKAVLSSQSGSEVVRLRAENSVGTQLWLQTPVDGVRFGAFVNNYQETPDAGRPAAQRPERGTTELYSFDAVRERGFVRAEYTSFKSRTNGRRGLYEGWYVMGGVKPTAPLTLAVEYSASNQLVNLPAPVEPLTLPASRDLAIGAAWAASPTLVFKLEGHRQEGYSFDTAVPTINPPTSGPPFRATLAPVSKAFYGIVSVAVSF
jgi:hypothetical protein